MSDRTDLSLADLSLADLVSPLSVEDFRARLWPRQLHVGAADAGRLAALRAVPELVDIHRLAAVYDEPVPVWFPPSFGERAKAVYGTKFRAREAIALHQAGATLFFQRVERWVPEARRMVSRLEHELGLLPGDGHCSVFASPGGHSALPHFDPDITFSVQVVGRKRWHVAPNEHVDDPLEGYSILADPTEVRQLRRHSRGPLPTCMPPAHSFDVEPGSLVFLPRGYWHATEAEEESVAVAFWFYPRSWARLLTESIEHLLCEDARWREHTGDLLEPGERGRAARAQLEQRLSELGRRLARVDADEVLQDLRRSLGEDRRYRRVAGSSIAVERRELADPLDHRLLVTTSADELHEVHIPAQLAPMGRWLAGREAEFSDRDLSLVAPEIDGEDRGRVLEALVHLGAFEPIHVPSPRGVIA